MRKISVYIYRPNAQRFDSYNNCLLEPITFKQFTPLEHLRYFARDIHTKFSDTSYTIEVADEAERVFVYNDDYRVYLDSPDVRKAANLIKNYICKHADQRIEYHQNEIKKSEELKNHAMQFFNEKNHT